MQISYDVLRDIHLNEIYWVQTIKYLHSKQMGYFVFKINTDWIPV